MSTAAIDSPSPGFRVMFHTTPKTMPRFENSTTQRPGWRVIRRASGPSGPGPFGDARALHGQHDESSDPDVDPACAPRPGRDRRARHVRAAREETDDRDR